MTSQVALVFFATVVGGAAIVIGGVICAFKVKKDWLGILILFGSIIGVFGAFIPISMWIVDHDKPAYVEVRCE